jgi:hypothetical protein
MGRYRETLHNIGEFMITKLSNTASEKIVSTNNAVQRMQRLRAQKEEIQKAREEIKNEPSINKFIQMKLRPFIVATIMFAAISLMGCSKSDNEEAREHKANDRQAIEIKTIACLGEKAERPEEIWSVFYDDERNMFTSAFEKVCISRYGNIIHSACENYFPMLGEGQIYSDDDFGIPKVIEYNIERNTIDLDFDKYRRKDDRNLDESTVVSYNKLRGPERHRMNRVVSCLNSANNSLKNAIEN